MSNFTKHLIAIFVSVVGSVSVLSANPVDGTVAAGEATITGGGNTVTINQTSARAIINWSDFSISAGELTRFVQPDAASAVLNRVISGNPSSLLGDLQANGKVYLLNPNGILVGDGARIDTAGFLASTLNVTDADFLAGGDLLFTGDSTAAITNLGAISASGGDIFLIARKVANSGTLTAPAGTVGLAAGSEVLLTTGGDERVFIRTTTAPGEVVNAGDIAAATAELKAAGGNAYALAINNTGTVRATGTAVRDGQVWLVAGSTPLTPGGTKAPGDAKHVNVGAAANRGTLAATDADGTGGFVETSGETIELTGRVTTGTGGQWLIDPTDVTIDAALAANAVTSLNAGTHVKIEADNNITVAASIAANGAGDLELLSDIDRSGAGTVIFDSGITIANAGSGDVRLFYNPTAYSTPTDFSSNISSGSGEARAFMWVHDVDDLQAVNTNLGGNYALSGDIDASATSGWNAGAGFVPIGDAGTSFTGVFDGRSQVVSGLTINRPTQDYVGLFGIVDGGAVRNLGLEGGSVTGDTSVGGLAGAILNSGSVTDSHAGNAVSGVSNVGGLAGQFRDFSAISRSYATGAVTGSGSNTGGLVGIVDRSGEVSQSYATGAVSGNNRTGGLIGLLYGSQTGSPPTLTQSYSTGTVAASGAGVGGLIGVRAFPATVSDNYYDSTNVPAPVSGVGPGITGLDTTTFQDGTLPAGFDDTVWSASAGSYPTLISTTQTYEDLTPVPLLTFTGTVTGAGAGIPLTLWINGASAATTTTTDGGAFSFSYDSALAAGTTAMIFTEGGNVAVGNRFAPLGDGGTSGVDVAASTVWVTSAATTLTSLLSDMTVTANGALFDAGMLFSINGDTLSLDAGVDLRLDLTAGTFDFNTALGLTGHDFILNGAGTLTGSSALTVDHFTLTGGNWVQTGTTLPTFTANDFTLTGGTFLRVLGGDGTQGAPYQLADVFGLQGVDDLLDKHFVLANDIDASATANWNDADGAGGADPQGFDPLGSGSGEPFMGTFDGAGHAISGLTINRSTTFNGLFASIGSGAVIRDVGLAGGSIKGGGNTGALAGAAYGGSSITRSYASATVANYSTPVPALGGLVGANGGSITLSYATGSVTNSSVGPALRTGGLVGLNTGSIANSYATGAVTANQWVGGLVGFNAGTIATSYATGSVTGGTATGALVGVAGTDLVTNSYWDSTVMATGLGSGSSGTAVGLPTTTFQNGTLPTGFDTSVWSTKTGEYPKLIWSLPHQTLAGTVTGAGADIPLTLWINGASVATTTTTAGGGFSFSFLEEGYDAGTTALVFATGGNSAVGNRLVPLTKDGTSGVNVAASTVWMTSAATTLTSLIADMGTTAGSLADAGLLYAVSGGVLTLNDGIDFKLDLTAGNFDFNTALGLNADITVNSTGNLAINQALSTNAGTDSGSITLDADGAIALNANVSIGNGGTGTTGSLSLTAGTSLTGTARLQVNNSSGESSPGSLNLTAGTIHNGSNDGLMVSNRYGVLNATITAADGELRLTTSDNITLGTLATPTDSAQTIVVAQTGPRGLLELSDVARTVAGDDITLISPGEGRGSSTNFNNPNHPFDIGDGSLTLWLDTRFNFNGGANSIVGEGGTVILAPRAVGNSLGVGTGATGTLAFDAGDLSVFADGFADIIFGRTDGAGAITLGDASFNDNVTVRTGTGTFGMASGRSVTTNGNALTIGFGGFGSISGSIATGAGDLTIVSTGTADLDINGANISSTTGDIAITKGTGISGANRLRWINNALLTTENGSITITTRDDNGWIVLGDDALGTTGGITATGDGTITLNLTNNLYLRNGYRLAANGGDIRVNAAGVAIGNFGTEKGTLSNPDGKVTLNVNGGVGDGSLGVVDAGELELLGTGTFTLTSGTNSIGTLAADVTGSLSILNNTGLTVGTVGDTSGVSTGSNNVTLVTSAGNITLDQAITATGAGNITLATAANFINSFGSTALGVDTGRWLVWSTNAANDTRGGLVPDFQQYGATYGTSTVRGTGNGFLYNYTPTITIELSGTAKKTYDGDDEASLDDVVITGNGSNGETFKLTGTAGTYDGVDVGQDMTVTVTGISTTTTADGIKLYGLEAPTSSSADIGEITPAGLVITANDASKTYGDVIAFDGTEFGSTGLVGEETIGSVTLTSTGTGATVGVAGSPYDIVASAATGGTFNPDNYTISYKNGALTINPKAITVTATGGNSTYGDTPENPGFTVSGLVNEETIAVLTGLTNSFGIGGTTSAGEHTVSVTGTLANANYTVTERTDGTWTVARRALTITADDQDKTYGDTFTFDGTEFGSSGLQNSETIGSVTLTSSGAAGTAGVEDSPYDITASAATGGTFNADNYTITYENGTLTVAPKAITVTAVGGNSTYGDTPENPGLAAEGLANGEAASVLTGLANSFGIGATTNAGDHTLSVAGTLSNANYTITEREDGTWTVARRALTITADDARKTYGATTTFAGTEFGSSGLQNGETVGSVTLASTGAGATAGVTNSPYTITASSATGGTFDINNYTITYENGSLTVAPKAITVTATGGTSIYGDMPTNPGFTASGLVNDETVAVLTGLANSFGIGATTNAGDHTLAVDGTLTNANYTIAQRNDGTWTITPRALTITADDASKTYGDTTTFAGTEFGSSGLQNGETVGGVTLASTGAGATADVTNSPYTITASAATGGTFDPDNYTISYENGSLTIAPKAITVTATGGTSIYGDTPTNPGFTASGLVNDETVAVLTGLANSFGIGATTNAGDHTLAVDGTLTNANYTITQRNDGTWTITPRALTITADDASKTYGDTTTFAGTEFGSSGLQNGETVGSVTLASTGAGATAGVTNSPYAITASSATGGTFDINNYTITYENGSLTVAPKAITVTATGGTSIYGDTPTNPGFTASGLVNEETVAVLTGLANSFGIGATTNAGDHTLAVNGALTNANYTITQRNDGTWVVTPRALTITADDATKTYGDVLTFNGDEFESGGLQNGETIGSVTLASEGTAADTNVAGSPYVITASSATGGTFDINNYTITYENGSLTVAPKAITVTATGGTSIYGDTPTNPGFTASGLVNDETVAVLTGLANSFDIGATTNAGDHTLAVNGALTNANYTITQRNDGTWVVTPRALNLTANNLTKTYGDLFTFEGTEFTPDGLQNGETIGSVSLASDGTAETAGVGDSPYAIAISQATGGTFNEDNYTITYHSGGLTVDPRELVVTMDGDQTKIYGDADPALTYTIGGGGLVNGDTLAGAPIRAAGESTGTYALAQGTLTASDNYTFTFAGDSFVITPRAITLTANPVSRVYGAMDPALGVALTGGTLGSVTVSDSLADVTGTLTRQGGANVGAYDILLGSGTAAANYTITYNADNNAFTITPAPLTITADDVTRDFGRANPSFTATIDGLVNNDTTDVISGLAFSTPATTGSAVGDYTITPFGASAGNYTIGFVDGKLTVKAAVVVGDTPVEVPTVDGTPVFNDTIAVIVLGDRLVIVPITNNQVAGGSIDSALAVTLGEVTSIPRATSSEHAAAAGTANQVSGINFAGFQVVAALGGGSGGSNGTSGALGDLPPDSGLFRESSVSMGKFNVVYREVIDLVRELSEEHTVFESSFENLPENAQPQVVLLKAAPQSAPSVSEGNQNNI